VDTVRFCEFSLKQAFHTLTDANPTNKPPTEGCYNSINNYKAKKHKGTRKKSETSYKNQSRTITPKRRKMKV